MVYLQGRFCAPELSPVLRNMYSLAIAIASILYKVIERVLNNKLLHTLECRSTQ